MEKVPLQLSPNAITVLEKRYLKKDANGRPVETPEEMFWRVAQNIAAADRIYDGETDTDSLAVTFYNLMVSLDFLPNSPTLMNAGRELQQLSACFVLPIEDDLDSIFTSVRNTALIQQSGGGTGFSFSRLRPKNDMVKSTGGVASGPISFMRVFNMATEVIKQGGTRRGANMGILHVSHPDIEDFIDCKNDPTAFTNFNISVGLSEDFMRQVEENGEYALLNPRSGELVRTIPARRIFDKIVANAWRSGEPGIVFLDRINRDNPTPAQGSIESTNPCITGDSWVMTADGPRQAAELVGLQVPLWVNGKLIPSGPEGFFATGHKEVVRLLTKEGYALTLTPDHLVARVPSQAKDSAQMEWVPANQLQVGDRVRLHDHRSGMGWEGPHSEGEGYLIGLLLGDGTLKGDKAVLSSWSKTPGNGEIDGWEGVRIEAFRYAVTLPHRADFKGWIPVKGRNEMRMAPGSLKTLAEELGLRPGRKAITPEVEKCSSSFYRGFLRGLYNADGSVQGSQAKGVSVRLSQSDLETLQAVQRMLIRLGIRSTLYSRRQAGRSLLPDGKGGMATYPTRKQYELVISCENVQRFHEQVGFAETEKNARLENALCSYRRASKREPFVATVIAIEPAGTTDVYDVQVPGVLAFDANGFYLHNCGEQPLLPYEACNLGSINLVKMVSPSDGNAVIDWDRLRDTVHLAVHFLDNVIDQNHYPLPEIAEMARGNRKIGLGVMGWADLLIRLRVPYDSEEALNLAEKLMEFIHREGIAASVQLATSRGVFPHFEQSLYATNGPRLRNATITTIAPTGTLSILAGCSSGIEPLFAIIYLRTVMDKTQMKEINPYFEHLAKLRGFHSPELMHAIAERGSIRGLDDVPKDIQAIFPIAYDVSPESHLRMQAAFQRHTDNAVSKTVNFPKEATEQDVERVFLLAFREGCKGVTIYRDGSRQEQVLSIPTNGKKEKNWEEMAQGRHKVARERPKMTHGTTERVETPRGKIYVTVNEDQAGVCEVFVESRDQEADGLSRLISLALRAGVDPQEIIEQLWRCESREAINDFSADGTRVLVRSIAQGVALAMGRRVWGPGYAGPFSHRTNDGLFTKPSVEPAGKRTIGGVCPECGNTLEYVEGCLVCRYCGYSKCA